MSTGPTRSSEVHISEIPPFAKEKQPVLLIDTKDNTHTLKFLDDRGVKTLEACGETKVIKDLDKIIDVFNNAKSYKSSSRDPFDKSSENLTPPDIKAAAKILNKNRVSYNAKVFGRGFLVTILGIFGWIFPQVRNFVGKFSTEEAKIKEEPKAEQEPKAKEVVVPPPVVPANSRSVHQQASAAWALPPKDEEGIFMEDFEIEMAEEEKSYSTESKESDREPDDIGSSSVFSIEDMDDVQDEVEISRNAERQELENLENLYEVLCPKRDKKAINQILASGTSNAEKIQRLKEFFGGVREFTLRGARRLSKDHQLDLTPLTNLQKLKLVDFSKHTKQIWGGQYNMIEGVQLPKGIGSLKNLQVLTFENVDVIRTIPPEVLTLPNLETLTFSKVGKLEGDEFFVLAAEDFRQLLGKNSLRELTLQECHISDEVKVELERVNNEGGRVDSLTLTIQD